MQRYDLRIGNDFRAREDSLEVLSLRIAILCLLVCVPGRDCLPAVSALVVETLSQFLNDAEWEDDELFNWDDSCDNSTLPATVEESVDDLDDSEETMNDCWHVRVGVIHSCDLAQFTDFAHPTSAFDESFVTFQPLRV